MTLFDPSPLHSELDPETTRLRFVVAYNGSRFRGFAAQPGVRTVGGELASELERLVRHRVELTCAGRTDAGVHARGQVITADIHTSRADPAGLTTSINRICGPEIVVRWAGEAPEGFDARFSALSRTYDYLLLNSSVPDPFLAETSWHVPAPLDLRAMRTGGDAFIGEHDFSSFCRGSRRADGTAAPLVRRVHDISWAETDDGLVRFKVNASSFCHQMVRSLVGTLVEVGTGRIRAGELRSILAARDRHAAGQMAPAHGLCLASVEYPGPWNSAQPWV